MALTHDTNKGAKCARETRAELGLGPCHPLPCILSVVEQLVRIPVAVIDLDGFAGAYLHWRGRSFVFIHERDSIPRKRFSLAHELVMVARAKGRLSMAIESPPGRGL